MTDMFGIHCIPGPVCSDPAWYLMRMAETNCLMANWAKDKESLLLIECKGISNKLEGLRMGAVPEPAGCQ